MGLKIGEGRYRRVFDIDGTRCIKILKPYVEKHYGPFSIRLPTRTYTKVKFGIPDFNEYEFQVYQQFFSSPPAHLRGCFERILECSELGLVAEIVRDFNGEMSKTLEATGIVHATGFWGKLLEVKAFLIENDIPLFDGIGSSSIMVKQLDANTAMPVLVDLKWFGPQLYPFQPHLRMQQFAREKINRRFSRLLRDHCSFLQEAEAEKEKEPSTCA